jgi:leucyl aminopeptidase (aminopeptidase T)
MKKLKFVVMGLMITGSLSISTAQTMKKSGNAEVYETLAQKLVTQCGAIKEGEIVMVTGSVRDNELLEDIVVNVRKQGAFPLLVIGSDRMTRRLFTEVPVKFDTQTPEMDMKFSGFVNAIISLETNENPGLLSDIAPERFVTINKVYEPVNELLIKRNVKGVFLGNGLYPTEARAKQNGLTLNELTDMFWNGVNVDYAKLEATGKSVKSILMTGKEVHITNPNGTDLKVRIENRPVIVSDGTLSPEDLQKGFASSQVYLPAGEVYLSPVPGTAEGKIMVENVFYQDKEITGLTLTFSQGKLTSMSAKSGLEPLKAYYDVAEAGKEEFSVIDLGINPNVKLKPGSKFANWVPAGMLTVAIGNNAWAGGENKSTFSYQFFLPGCTIVVDGKTLVDKGNLKN